MAVEDAPPAIAAAPRPTGRLGFSVRTFEALSSRDFRHLFVGNTLQFGSMQMQMLVRGVLVFEFTGSYAALGQVSLAHAIPGLLLTPLGGLVADRAPRKTVIQIAQSLNLVNSWVLALLAFSGVLSFEHLIISAVLQGVVNAIMMPTRQAIVPDLVPRPQMMNAVALVTAGQNLMSVIGPALGGLLISFTTPATAFGLMGGMYALAFLFTVRIPKHPIYAMDEAARTTPRRGGGLSEMWVGMRFVASDPVIRTLLTVNFILVLISMPYTMMLPGFVKEVLHEGAAQQGVLMTMSGIGAVAGSLMIASMGERKRGKLLIVTGFVLGLSLLAFSLSTNYYVTIPIMLVVGFGHAMRMSIGQVLVQHYTPDEYRGRVMSVWMLQFSIMSLGTFGVGLLSEAFGPQWAIGGMAATLVVLMIGIWAFVPLMRRIE